MMYLEERSRALIRRADVLLQKSQSIQEKANLATRHFYRVMKSNDELLAVLHHGATPSKATGPLMGAPLNPSMTIIEASQRQIVRYTENLSTDLKYSSGNEH